MTASSSSDIVRLTGKAAVIIGAFVVGISVISMANLVLLKSSPWARSSAMPQFGSNFATLFRHALPISLVQCAFGVSTLLSGIGLMRKDRRARAVLECVTWLAIVLFPIGTLIWLYFMLATMGATPAPFRLAAIGVGTAMSAGFAIGFGLALRHLRSPRLRMALNEPEYGP